MLILKKDLRLKARSLLAADVGASGERLPSDPPILSPCCIFPPLLFCWQVIIGPLAGPLPRVHCQRRRGVFSKQGISMQMEGRKRAGLGRREFKVAGQTLLRLDWGAVNHRRPRGRGAQQREQRWLTKRAPALPQL